DHRRRRGQQRGAVGRGGRSHQERRLGDGVAANAQDVLALGGARRRRRDFGEIRAGGRDGEGQQRVAAVGAAVVVRSQQGAQRIEEAKPRVQGVGELARPVRRRRCGQL